MLNVSIADCKIKDLTLLKIFSYNIPIEDDIPSQPCCYTEGQAVLEPMQPKLCYKYW